MNSSYFWAIGLVVAVAASVLLTFFLVKRKCDKIPDNCHDYIKSLYHNVFNRDPGSDGGFEFNVKKCEDNVKKNGSDPKAFWLDTFRTSPEFLNSFVKDPKYQLRS